MNIRCPHCQTVFRVNPDRIPASGVRAKCARCGDTFLVTPPPAGAPRPAAPARAPASREATSATAPPPAAPPPATPPPPSRTAEATAAAATPAEPAAPAPADAVSAEVVHPRGAVPLESGATGGAHTADARQPGRGAMAPSSAGSGAVATGAAPASAPPAEPMRAASFGAKDPRAKAERLARALVSDIVAYHPERREQSLTNGSLRTEFRDEIMKSWEEYVAQVGIEVAKSTPYFRDALNTILAKGQRIF